MARTTGNSQRVVFVSARPCLLHAGDDRRVRDSERGRIRRRLAALSSLYKHLVRHGHAAKNPVTEVERPAINRIEGSTLAFSKAQARKILDAPMIETPEGTGLSRREERPGDTAQRGAV
jgi:site-specific recombinase XerD